MPVPVGTAIVLMGGLIIGDLGIMGMWLSLFQEPVPWASSQEEEEGLLLASWEGLPCGVWYHTG